MNLRLTLSVAISVTMSTLAAPVRAANNPRAGTNSQNPVIWTNDDLERLHGLDLISIVGRRDEEQPASASTPTPYKETPAPESSPAPYVKTQDPEWYAEQAARLRDELERRRMQLSGYRQAMEDARSLKTIKGGINLDDGDIAITPEAGIQILQDRVSETLSELGGLEDLARHNDIPPGTLRGQ